MSNQIVTEANLLKEILINRSYAQALIHILVDEQSARTGLPKIKVQEQFYKLQKGMLDNIKIHYPDIFND